MDTDAVRTVLETRAAEIEQQMAEMSAPPKEIGSISFGKRVGEGTAMAVDRLAAVSAHGHLGETLEEIRRALAKLDAGSYGVCDVCGDPIPEGRLEARPWATRCVQDS